MQESRLFKILYYLLEKGRTTAPELAKRFEVSVRTIYRDMDALFQIDSEDWLEADFSRWGEQTRDNEKFEDIKKAVIGRKSIKIQYEGSYYGGSERIVYPLKLMYKAKEWYLKAFCTQKQDLLEAGK